LLSIVDVTAARTRFPHWLGARRPQAETGAGAMISVFHIKACLLAVFWLIILATGSGCARKPIQSHGFDFTQRSEMAAFYDAYGKDAHITYFLPKSALNLTMQDGEFDFTHLTVVDPTRVYLVTKEQPLFIKSNLTMTDSYQTDGAAPLSGQIPDGLLDHVRFTTQTDVESENISNALEGLSQSVNSNVPKLNTTGTSPQATAAIINEQPFGSAPYGQYTFVSAASGSQAKVNDEAKTAPDFSVSCTEHINLNDGGRTTINNNSEKYEKSVCSDLQMLNELGYKIDAKIISSFPFDQQQLSADQGSENSAEQNSACNYRLNHENTSKKTKEECSAIFHRKRWPITISITLYHDDLKNGKVTLTKQLPIFDTHHVYKTPIRGKPLVGVTTNASFSNGELVYYSDDRPSSITRAILFPAEVVASTFGFVVAVVTVAF